jgi:hypothetical protein
LLVTALVLVICGETGQADSQGHQPYIPRPKAVLIPAPTMKLPGEVDSNSPAIWSEIFGRPALYVLTSIDGTPRRSFGFLLEEMCVARDVMIDPWPTGGNWLEAVVADAEGTWYGYYHNERKSPLCGDEVERVAPRIGAARSRDRGRTWEDLGIILEAAPDSDDCSSWNTYFVGGVGDFSVMLDPDEQDLYIFFSQYGGPVETQGVAIARLPWADRDDPVGKTRIFADNDWVPAQAVENSDGDVSVVRWNYPSPAPLFPARDSWHNGDEKVDAFWGPSIHWNTSLQMYVMLLNRAKDIHWTQEGVYVSYATRLDDPSAWSMPRRLMVGGRWYPQVLGLEFSTGTDKIAGDTARFFMAGQSDYLIKFLR